MHAQGHGCALAKLDLRDNQVASLQELAVLAGCPALRELLLQGGPGNAACDVPCYCLAVAAALPQLTHLDGQPLERGDASAGATAQYVAAMQLQAFQPPAPPSPPRPEQRAPPLPQQQAAEQHLPSMQQQQALPVLMHPAATESIADSLVQRLAQSGAMGGLWGDPAQHSAAQREAALEARLTALLEERPVQQQQPVQAANRRSSQLGSGASRAPAGNSLERRDSAAQTDSAGPGMQRLQVPVPSKPER